MDKVPLLTEALDRASGRSLTDARERVGVGEVRVRRRGRATQRQEGPEETASVGEREGKERHVLRT